MGWESCAFYTVLCRSPSCAACNATNTNAGRSRVTRANLTPNMRAVMVQPDDAGNEKSTRPPRKTSPVPPQLRGRCSDQSVSNEGGP